MTVCLLKNMFKISGLYGGGCHECDDDYDEMKKECELAVGYIKEKS